MKFFHYMLIASGLGVLVCASQAPAQTADAAGTYGQLSSLVSQIAILKAQLQIVQLKQQIAASNREMLGYSQSAQSMSVQPGLSATPSRLAFDNTRQELSMPTGRSGLEPHILSISGQGWRLSALLRMPDGGEVEAVPGTLLGDGLVVKAVSPDSVRVIQNGRLVALPFAASYASGRYFAPGG